MLQNLDDRQWSTRQDGFDEGSVLVRYRDGGRGGNCHRDGLWGVGEFTRVDETRVVIQREEPGEVEPLLHRQFVSRGDRGGTYLDVFEGRDELLEVGILPHSKHRVLRPPISYVLSNHGWRLT